MPTFLTISKKIRNINIQMIIIEVFSLSNIQKWMIEKQKARLYNKGEDVEGQKFKTNLGNPYSQNTINIKKTKGQPTDRVTFKDEGEFYLSMKIIMSLFGFEFDANFQKKDGNIYRNFTKSYPSKMEFESKTLGITELELKQIIETKALPEIKIKINAILH